MTLNLYEAIRRIVREELGVIRTAELGIVQEQHPHASDSDQDNYACTVALRDSGLVLKQVPVVTSRIGSVSIPAAGDLVLVQFIRGDVNAPVIVGSLYNDEDRPPVSDDGQAIIHLPLGAGDEDAVHLELHSGETRSIIARLGSAISVEVKDDDPVVSLDVDGGKATLTIDRDGAITVESQGAIQLKGSEVTIEAQGTLTLKGSTVNIN